MRDLFLTMSKKRILEFSTYAKIGGTQRMLLEFLRHASHEKYDYSMCVLLDRDVLNEKVSQLGIENTSLNMRGYWDATAWWKLYRFAQSKRFDLIRTYGLKADIIGRIVGKILGIPVNITSVRSTDPWRKWYHVLLDSLTAPFTDLYLSNSEAGRLAVCRREKIPASKTFTIPNGIDLKKYDPQHVDEERVNALKAEWGIRSTTKVIGIVANLCKMKGHNILVDALPHIQDKFPEIKCLFVGTDFLAGEIQQYVRQRACEQTVIFTGFQEDIPEILALMDIFVLPSQWEGLPTALLEAMAMKTPVIASSVGGIPELVEHEKSGILIPPDRSDALAKATILLLGHPEISRKMATCAYQQVEKYFSIHSMVSQTEIVYEQLITKKTFDRTQRGSQT
ncbi:MAG: glycosyltransferase [bacterium]|nr:glycosyltransferase [bacterium]